MAEQTESEKMGTAFVNGQNSIWLQLYSEARQHLNLTEAEKDISAMVAERRKVIALLRELCAEYGDNDWDENLHLCDVINKHLFNYIEDLVPSDIP